MVKDEGEGMHTEPEQDKLLSDSAVPARLGAGHSSSLCQTHGHKDMQAASTCSASHGAAACKPVSSAQLRALPSAQVLLSHGSPVAATHQTQLCMQET